MNSKRYGKVAVGVYLTVFIVVGGVAAVGDKKTDIFDAVCEFDLRFHGLFVAVSGDQNGVGLGAAAVDFKAFVPDVAAFKKHAVALLENGRVYVFEGFPRRALREAARRVVTRRSAYIIGIADRLTRGHCQNSSHHSYQHK